jgi:hypothetical protein
VPGAVWVLPDGTRGNPKVTRPPRRGS